MGGERNKDDGDDGGDGRRWRRDDGKQASRIRQCVARGALDVIPNAAEEEEREEEARQEVHVAKEEVRQEMEMEIEMPRDEGVRGEDTREDDNVGDENDAIDEVKWLLRWSMVKGEEEIPSRSPLPRDMITNQRVVDL